MIKGADQNGELLAMRYAVADVAMPLDSVSQICDTWAHILFTRWGGLILGPAGRVDFKRVGDTYVRITWVRRPKKKIPTPKSKPEVPEQSAGDDGPEQDVEMTAAVVSTNRGTTSTSRGTTNRGTANRATRPFGRLGH